MKTFSLHVLRDQNVFQLKIEPFYESFEYSLYIVIKNEKGETNIIKRYWYSPNNEFLYIFDNIFGDIYFHYFIRNKSKEIVYKKIVRFNYKFRNNLRLESINFNKPLDSTVLLNYDIPIKYQPHLDTNQHIVLLNGALSKGYKIYPIFHRYSWKERFSSNILNIYDASLNKTSDYLLAWYQGTYEKPLLPDIIKIIEHLKNQKNICNKDLVFYGSSAGGWTALKLAEHFNGSIAVAINAQTNILEYASFSPKAMELFLKKTFPEDDIESVRKKYIERLTIDSSKFRKTIKDKSSRIIYAQNKDDIHHYERHFKGFWRSFSQSLNSGWDDDKHNYSIIYEYPNGHGAEPNFVFDQIMNILIEMKKID